MGVLETRAGFENVIMLSVNEGILPKGKSENSLLLFDIKNILIFPLITKRCYLRLSFFRFYNVPKISI